MNLWHLVLAQGRGNVPLNQKERNKVWNVDDLDLQPQGPGTEFILSNARNPQRKCGNYSLIASVTSAPCLLDAVTSPELNFFFLRFEVKFIFLERNLSQIKFNCK